MPRRAVLKVVNRPGTPTLYVRGTVSGIRVYESTGTDKPELAERYRTRRADELYTEGIHGKPAKANDDLFADAVVSYLETERRSTNTRSFVKKLLLHFPQAKLSEIDQAAVDVACKTILRDGSSGATKLRQVITPIRAILRHAASRGMVTTVPVIKTPKTEKVRRTFLRPAEVVALIRAASPTLRPMLAFAVATGARPAEYLDLEWKDVDLRGRRVTLALKGGGTRSYDMPQLAMTALESIKVRDGAVFRPEHGKSRYRSTGRSSGGQFSVAWAGACQRAGLPGEVRVYARKDRAKGPSYERFAPEHTPYVLRHTWASWHYAIHKDIIKLERDGAWEGPDMVRVYAHLMPEAYRQEALDVLEGRVDLGFGAPGADKRFRAVAVQLGRTAPLGRLKRA